ncbi:peptidoglycan-binding protein [Streptomyces sp. NPDC000410]|uniref:peptidoglycan-binding domain-containing protein n=1 Tax=Streptomyces sp. NPDC000410 TaxID=3154254 RepID=UPI00332A8832
MDRTTFRGRSARILVGTALAAAVGAGATITAVAVPSGQTQQRSGSDHYTPAEATSKLKAAGISWKSSRGCNDKYRSGCTSFQGIRKATIDGIIDFKRSSRCSVVITGAAEVPPHSTRGEFTHGKGYKVDIGHSSCVNRYISSHARKAGRRGDGAALWTAGDVVYAKERTHWDIAYRGPSAGRPSPGPSTPDSRTSWPTLRTGSHGAPVTTAQHLLRAAGASIEADGQYGAATAGAVKEFQRGRGLTADGVIGSATWQRLAATLRPGAQGDAVTALQQQLRRQGASIGADGQYGPATARAVKEFQRGRGLTADGVTGPATWRQLLAGR